MVPRNGAPQWYPAMVPPQWYPRNGAPRWCPAMVPRDGAPQCYPAMCPAMVPRLSRPCRAQLNPVRNAIIHTEPKHSLFSLAPAPSSPLYPPTGSLHRHMTTHSELRPFMCPYCNKTFKTACNCKKHMKVHRMEIAIQTLTDGSSTNQNAVITQQVALHNSGNG